MRCVTIDDEPLALAQIAGYIEKTPFLELVGKFPGAIEASVFLADNDVDLIFVDINMPDINGMDFIKSLPVKPLVIFTTAYSEYALEGFRVDATDYLLKPISYPDFLHSAEKAYRQHRLASGHNKGSEQDYVFIKSEYKSVQLSISKITHIESRSEYLRIYSEDNKPVMTLGSMRSFGEKLPQGKFMRIHRSYIINTDKIASVERSSVVMSNGERIPVGNQYLENFKDFIKSHSF